MRQCDGLASAEHARQFVKVNPLHLQSRSVKRCKKGEEGKVWEEHATPGSVAGTVRGKMSLMILFGACCLLFTARSLISANDSRFQTLHPADCLAQT
eukprot:s138_g29.t1